MMFMFVMKYQHGKSFYRILSIVNFDLRISILCHVLLNGDTTTSATWIGKRPRILLDINL